MRENSNNIDYRIQKIKKLVEKKLSELREEWDGQVCLVGHSQMFLALTDTYMDYCQFLPTPLFNEIINPEMKSNGTRMNPKFTKGNMDSRK